MSSSPHTSTHLDPLRLNTQKKETTKTRLRLLSRVSEVSLGVVENPSRKI